MGTNEFANQQPTQNLVGGGGRGISTLHTTQGAKFGGSIQPVCPSLPELLQLRVGI